MQDLPPVYQPRKSSFTRFLYSLITLFIMLAALPIGVYLVGHQTNFQQKAATKIVTKIGGTSFSLEDVKGSQPGGDDLIPVDVLVQSEKDNTNLYVAKITFPPNLLEVQKIATSSSNILEKQKNRYSQRSFAYFSDKWVDSSFDNQKGEISLIAGMPNPGLKTEPNAKYVLATIYFKAHALGNALVSFSQNSAIYKNADNLPIELKKNELTLKLESAQSFATPSATPKLTTTKNGPELKLLSPQGGESYSYTSSIPVSWKATGVKDVSIWLYMNGTVLGKIATASATVANFSFKPADFVSPTFVTDSNSFALEITSVSAKGESVSDKTKGPIGIIAKKDVEISASQSANLASRGGDINKDGKIDLTDLSALFSRYNSQRNLGIESDLNGDGVINDVDLYFMRQLLLQNKTLPR